MARHTRKTVVTAPTAEELEAQRVRTERLNAARANVSKHHLRQVIERVARYEQNTITSFANELITNTEVYGAYQTFEWADNAMKASAKLRVLRDVLRFVMNTEAETINFAQVLEVLQYQFMSSACSASNQSTSISSTAMSTHYISAYAEAVNNDSFGQSLRRLFTDAAYEQLAQEDSEASAN